MSFGISIGFQPGRHAYNCDYNRRDAYVAPQGLDQQNSLWFNEGSGVFRGADQDFSGSLSGPEFVQALKQAGLHHIPDDQLWQWFSQADHRHDGRLSEREFVEFYATLKSQIPPNQWHPHHGQGNAYGHQNWQGGQQQGNAYGQQNWQQQNQQQNYQQPQQQQNWQQNQGSYGGGGPPSDLIIYHDGQFRTEQGLDPVSSQRRFDDIKVRGQAVAIIRYGQIVNIFVGDGFRPTFMQGVQPHLTGGGGYSGQQGGGGPGVDTIVYHDGQFRTEYGLDTFSSQRRFGEIKMRDQAVAIIRGGQIVQIFVSDIFRPSFMQGLQQHLTNPSGGVSYGGGGGGGDTLVYHDGQFRAERGLDSGDRKSVV